MRFAVIVLPNDAELKNSLGDLDDFQSFLIFGIGLQREGSDLMVGGRSITRTSKKGPRLVVSSFNAYNKVLRDKICEM
jgi:hypothetical protein